MVLTHPGLWPAAALQALRLAPVGWWHRWPPLPLPGSQWWRFRMETAYGGAGDRVPEEDDVVSYLEWCRQLGSWWRV